MRRPLVFLLAIVFLSSGCASLRIQKTDHIALKATKALTRVPLGVATIGMSEIWFAIDRRMARMVGRSRRELVMAWGEPSDVVEVDDGEIFIYREGRSYTSPATVSTSYGLYSSFSTYTPSTTSNWTVERRFFLNRAGIVTQYTWQGL